VIPFRFLEVIASEEAKAVPATVSLLLLSCFDFYYTPALNG
jgi:hypothetical protein